MGAPAAPAPSGQKGDKGAPDSDVPALTLAPSDLGHGKQAPMDIGRITDANTKQALESIRRAEPLGDNALLGLDIVRRRLHREGVSDSRESREWALAGLLDERVREALAEMRGEPLEQGASIEEERERLGGDFALGDADWEAWSCLYYRYLAGHKLQIQEIAAVARPGSPHGRRHVGRRLERGVRLLARALQDAEQLAAVDADGALPWKHNLPLRRSSFVGRERETKDLARLVLEPPPVTLVGPGGVGKTRLALHVAERLRASFPDGAWLVELASLDEPGLVPQVVARELGVEESAGRSPLASLERALRSKRLLLVLDNCEHLLEACAGLADRLLARSEGLRVLATSREALGVEGEQVWPLPALSLPSSESELEASELLGYSAPRLFAERARAVNPKLVIGGDTGRIVARICRTLDGLPLAIELAAARTDALSVAEILARLDGRQDLLARGRRSAAPRQQTLDGAIRWSYDLLSEPERAALRRLSVFRGGWTEPAARAVLDDAIDAQDLLARLAAKSLVMTAELDGETRCGMLETIRRFASARLEEAGEAAQARARHRSHYLALAESSRDALDDQRQAATLARLAREQDNFRAALEVSSQDQAATAEALRLVGALARFWQLRGRPGEGREQIEAILALPEPPDLALPRAGALVAAGELAYQQGDYDIARAHLDEALALFRAEQDGPGEADALRSLGKVADAMGDYDEARRRYEAARSRYEALDDAWGVAASVNNLGLVALREGDTAAARAGLETSLDAFRGLDDRWAVGVTLSNLADVAEADGEPDAARALFQESLGVSRELDDRDGVAYALTCLGSLAARRGDSERARALLAEAHDALRDLGLKPVIAEWLEASALLALADEDPSRAARLFGAAEALRDDIRAPLAAKDLATRDHVLSALRSELGETGLRAATEIGRGLTWRQAAVLAAESTRDR